MQLKNDYDKEVWNGDVGRVLEVQANGSVRVAFDDGAGSVREVSYTVAQSNALALAYCATVHKSQGGEFPAVVIPVLTEHYVLLARSLLYTAITRGKRLVVLAGQRRAVEIAVENDGGRRRRSWLAGRVRALGLPG
jgi:exodeoxyribonuclease V alpha subunit